MKKKERAYYILNKLNEIYPETPIPLNHKSEFELLIAVLLSAQCTDERVNKVTPELFKKANTPAKILKMSSLKIENIIKPCGLGPQKSLNIFNLSKIILPVPSKKIPLFSNSE